MATNEAYYDSGAAWKHYMLSGDFTNAWEISDRVLALNRNKPQHHLPRHLQQVWKGDSLENKRVLIRCYHGLGDTIQFIRYAKLVKQIAKEVSVWVQPDLMNLVSSVEGVDQVFPLDNGVPTVEFDVDVEVMELPYVFRSTIDSIPTEIPYIYNKPVFLNHKAGNMNIGLVWETGNFDKRRCISFELLKPLFTLNNVNFYILQVNATELGWQQGYGIHPGNFSLTEYAGVLKGLDLLITVDSMPAHLAGAQAVPVWNLLHAEADWRWMYNINYSPWYPSMKLFRQPEPGNWQQVIENVRTALHRKVMSKAA